MAQYADIIEIVAPSQAAPGSRVDITVRVKNLYSAPIGIMVAGVPEYPGLPGGVYIDGLYPQQAVANVNAGATYSFSGYFNMPNSQVTIHIYSYWYGADNAWHLDDEMTRSVSLTPSYTGQITGVVIRKNSSDLSVPASLKVGDSCELHAFGKLASTSPAVKCGMKATVTKPDTTQLSGKYEMSTKQDPGQELRFSIMNISVDKAGSWSAVIDYYATY
jgi:hypothetical protein